MGLDLAALGVTALISLFLPYLSALIVHSRAPMWVQSLVPGLLAALTAAATTVLASEYETVTQFFTALLAAWVIAARSYLAGAGKLVAESTAEFGIGGREPRNN